MRSKENENENANLNDHLESVAIRSQGTQDRLGTLAVPYYSRFYSPAQGYDQRSEEDA